MNVQFHARPRFMNHPSWSHITTTIRVITSDTTTFRVTPSQVVVGCWLLVVLKWLLVVGCWLLVGGWWLVVGGWCLVFGVWCLVFGVVVVGCWLLVVGCLLFVVCCLLLLVVVVCCCCLLFVVFVVVVVHVVQLGECFPVQLQLLFGRLLHVVLVVPLPPSSLVLPWAVPR